MGKRQSGTDIKRTDSKLSEQLITIRLPFSYLDLTKNRAQGAIDIKTQQNKKHNRIGIYYEGGLNRY